VGLFDDSAVGCDLVLLRGHQENLQVLPVRSRGRPKDRVVDVGLFIGIGNVVLGLPDDRFGELLLFHRGQRDPLNDDGIARDRDDDVLVDDLAFIKKAADGLGDGRRVDDRALDDGVARERFIPDPGHLEKVGLAFLPDPQLHRFDGV